MELLPRTVAVTERKGGEWIDFEVYGWKDGVGRTVYSIKFEDGSVWDAHNGWRSRARTTPVIVSGDGWAEAAFDSPTQSPSVINNMARLQMAAWVGSSGGVGGLGRSR